MRHGTLRYVARSLGVSRGHVRAAIGAGIIQPVGYRQGGGHRYTRLFDLADVEARRGEILAAVNGTGLEPVRPRTHRRRASPTPAPYGEAPQRTVTRVGSEPCEPGWYPQGCTPVPRELSEALAVQFAAEEREEIWQAAGLPVPPDVAAEAETARRYAVEVDDELRRQGRR